MKKLKQHFNLTPIFWCLLLGLTLTVTAAQSQNKVYITRTGEKYHLSTCRYLKYSSYEIDVKEAKERGYTACSVCKPGDGQASKSTTSPSQQLKSNTQPTQRATSVQCSATTQAGSRCKRMTTNANGKCWQHQ